MSWVCFKIIWEEGIQWDLVEIRQTMNLSFSKLSDGSKDSFKCSIIQRLFCFVFKESKSLTLTAELFAPLY